MRIPSAQSRAHSFAVVLLSAFTLAIYGCGGGDDSGSTGASPPVTTTLPGIATITFPPGALPPSTELSLQTTTSAETASDFLVTSQVFSAGPRSSYEVRALLSQPPLADFTVDLTVPGSVSTSLPPGSEFQVFSQIFESQGDETLDNFQLFPSTYDPTSNTLRTSLPKEAFTQARRSDGKYEAVMIVSSTPTLPTSPGPIEPGPAIEAPPRPLGVSPERLFQNRAPFNESGSVNVSAAAQGVCNATSIGPPLKRSLTRTSAFNGRTHFGTDYATAASGDDVIAVADGTIEQIGLDERPLKTPDPRSGKLVKGWGRYVIIRHTDGSKTLYAHLKTDSTTGLLVNQPVTKGQRIGEADNSGGSSGPHLHLEYVPNGKLFKNPNKIDPEPCIGSLVTGSITVRDSGSLADDAFQVFLNNVLLGQTAIGGANSFSASGLRSGTATLRILCIVAPDNIGTMSVSLGNGLIFQDGSVAQSADLPQGGSVTYTILIP